MLRSQDFNLIKGVAGHLMMYVNAVERLASLQGFDYICTAGNQ